MSTSPDPSRNAYFGDLHVHTAWSLDAYMMAAVNGPDEAFRFAKGEPTHSSLMNSEESRLQRPLDFSAVTDHAEWLGEFGLVIDEGFNPKDAEARQRIETYRHARVMRKDGRAGDFAPMTECMKSGMIDPDPKRLNFGPEKRVREAATTIWGRTVEIANRHNEPGRFTALIGFEWTPTPNGVNLHRVVLFQGDSVPELPLSNYEAIRPEQLWDWLETAAGGPGNVLAITHNANASGGAMFNPRYSDGRQLDIAYARRRALWEPLTEVHQIKGNSETSPVVSPDDPFADFEQLGTVQLGEMTFGGAVGQRAWATVRGGLQEGLRQQERVGVNPFQVGFVGGGDDHSGQPGDTEANDYVGSHGMLDDTVDLRLRGTIEGGLSTALLNPGGLTGIWADENTRESLFDALRRRETFCTSGVRIVPRLFGGWDFSVSDLRGDLVKTGYQRGVAMGGELTPRPKDAEAPTLLVHAAKDAIGANLDRIQIVKCWTKRGMLFEKLYDVAASGGRRADPRTDAVPPLTSTVDVNRATYTNDIGSAELSAVWIDADFDPSVPCLYYARIVEIPTPRWSTYDAVRHGKPLRTSVPAAVQQRAWTSPVWYTPSEEDRRPERDDDGAFTVARLADRGIQPMTDDAIRKVTVGRTLRTVNLVTGEAAIISYGEDGKRTLIGLSDRPLVTPYEIRNGRRIETSLLGDQISVALFSVDGRILGARDDEAGYVNFEAFNVT